MNLSLQYITDMSDINGPWYQRVNSFLNEAHRVCFFYRYKQILYSQSIISDYGHQEKLIKYQYASGPIDTH